MKHHMRRTHLTFRGFAETPNETWDHLSKLLPTFCKDSMKIDAGELERAHRLEHRKEGRAAYHHRELQALPGGSVLTLTPSSMAAAILQRDAPVPLIWQQQAGDVSLNSTVCLGLPADLMGVMWRFAWAVQPMRGRLRSWGVTISDSCAVCGRTESNNHILYECHTARIFWGLIRCHTSIRCPVQFLADAAANA